jgi:hypothetical protein
MLGGTGWCFRFVFIRMAVISGGTPPDPLGPLRGDWWQFYVLPLEDHNGVGAIVFKKF